MKRFSLIAFASFVLMTGCANPNTFMGQKVIDVPFRIAAGQTITVRATDAGPIPAENDQFKIEAAGFNIGSPKGKNQTAALTWMFSFTSKKSRAVDQVVVEEVSPSDPAVVVLRDESPQLKSNYWSGFREPLDVSQESLPWLYSAKTSIFVFKFTIKPKGESPQILYQAAWFPATTKAMFIQHANQLRATK